VIPKGPLAILFLSLILALGALAGAKVFLLRPAPVLIPAMRARIANTAATVQSRVGNAEFANGVDSGLQFNLPVWP